MKLAIENFFQPAKCGLLAVIAVSAVFVTPLNAGEHEIWYDSKGKPAILKDKTTGKMRLPTAEELAAFELVVEKATPTEPETDPAVEPTQTSVTPQVMEQSSMIPSILMPKVYEENRYYLPYRNSYSPYYSTYPYISGAAVPQFSNNGYYGPTQYYYPRNQYFYNNGYHGTHHSGYRGGYLLRYSRPGFSIRARF